MKVKTFGAGSWKYGGTPGLQFFNRSNDVSLTGGALVQQRLYFEKDAFTPNEDGGVDHGVIKFKGWWNSHYLE